MAEVVCTKCGKSCKSLQGWKMHMSSSHGGYNDADIAEVAGIGGGEGDVRSRMENFASGLPGSEGESETLPPQGGESAAPAGPIPISGERRVRATPKKLKKILGGIPAKILESTGIKLDREDEETLDEAGEFLGDIFGFEFSVPESKVMVQSRLWAVVWVFGVAGLVYVKHRFPEVFKAAFKAMKKDNGQEAPDSVDGV
jgi:hypothetical protein